MLGVLKTAYPEGLSRLHGGDDGAHGDGGLVGWVELERAQLQSAVTGYVTQQLHEAHGLIGASLRINNSGPHQKS